MNTNFDKVEQWYDERYKTYGEETMRPQYAYQRFLDLLNIHKGEKGKKVLDIACGTGFLLKLFAEREWNTYGVDISKEAVQVARTISPESDIKQAVAEKLPFSDRYFDVVTCLGSLEHFLDPGKALMEMRRVAKSGAKYCIVVPNSNYIFYKIKGSYGTDQQAIKEDLRSLKEWKRLFKDNQFSIQEIHHDDWILNNTQIHTKEGGLRFLKNLIKRVIWRFLPLKYTYQFIFILS